MKILIPVAIILTLPIVLATTEIHTELHVEGVTEINQTINNQSINATIQGPGNITIDIKDNELNYEIQGEQAEVTTNIEGDYEIHSDDKKPIIGTGLLIKTFNIVRSFMLKIGLKL